MIVEGRSCPLRGKGYMHWVAEGCEVVEMANIWESPIGNVH